MALFKKNIWLIFYVLTFCATLFFGFISYLKWESIYLKNQSSQETVVEIFTNATHSLFDTQERLMDILGVSIIEDEHYIKDTEDIEKHALPLLKNPAVAAFGVTRTDGSFIYGSSDKDPTKIPNLLALPESKKSFLEVLQSQSMVFGRTYFSPDLNLWVMPVRKTLRDINGEALIVLTTLLKPNAVFDKLLSTLRHRENLSISIIRASDLYLQYASNDEANDEILYATPFPKELLEQAFSTIYKNYHLTSDALKKNETLVSFTFQDTQGIRYLTSLKYNKTYHLWTIAHTPMNSITQHFLVVFVIYFFIYLAIGTLFFLLFRVIVSADLKRKNDLIFQATHDKLTGLPNRSYLQQHIHKWLHKEASAFALLYVDMDHFKNINDTFGHQCGDYVLVELAKRLQNSILPDAVVIRQGGDEFVIFVYTQEDEQLLKLSASIIHKISQPYAINKLKLSMSASIGIAKYPEHGEDLDTLLRAADIAMYESKKIKNSVHIFANTMQEGYLKNLHIEQALRSAIGTEELFMLYQPQVDTQENIVGVEALIRWNSPTLGMVPPDCFIPIAEASGLMLKLGRLIIKRVLDEMKDVQEITSYHFQTSINISVRQFMDPEFFEHLLHSIEITQTKHITITLEVTENLFIEDIDYILPLLEKIRILGIKISMDDFGTGYSSLSILRKLPIDELKIDKSFIDTIVEDTGAQKMVQSIMSIGYNLNLEILAEGVETKAQKELLLSLGCDKFQGYYFAKPMSKEALITLLKKATSNLTCKDSK